MARATARRNAGGRATASGTNYQAGAIAYIGVHMLAQARLGWFGLDDAVPVAVAAETGGGGDDIGVEFGDDSAPIELQAKRTLSGGRELQAVLEEIRSREAPNANSPVGLVLGRSSSRKLWEVVPRDIDRLRSGTTRPVGADVEALRLAIGDQFLSRLYLVAADFDRIEDLEPRMARELLRGVLLDPSQDEQAWAVLVADAQRLSSLGLRRTRKDIVKLLTQKGIPVRPLQRDEKWLRELDFIQSLLEARESVAAGVALSRLASQVKGTTVQEVVSYRIYRLMGVAALQQGRYGDALSHAQKALDIAPTGAEALRTASVAALYAGDTTMALRYADEGLSSDRHSPKAWGVVAQVYRAAGMAMPDAPAEVLSDPHYLTVLSELAADSGSWDEVVELTGRALQSGQRAPETLFYRANALLTSSNEKSEEVRRGRLVEADRLTTELLELIHEGHPLAPKALVIRSTARGQLGQAKSAAEDLERARQLDPDEPEAIRIAASHQLAMGEDEVALQLLNHHVVDDAPLLLGIRAEVKARLGDLIGGRRDLAMADQKLGGSSVDDNARLAIAEAATELGELDTAERLVAGLTPQAASGAWAHLFRGRILMRRGMVSEAEEQYHRAAGLDPKARPGILAELGVHLLQVPDRDRAVQAFRDSGPMDLDAVPMRAYLQALIDTNDLVSAQSLIAALSERGPLPVWALAVATNIALQQEDPTAAIQHLRALGASGATSPQARVALAKSLVEAERLPEADEEIAILLDDANAGPLERMQAAELLDMRGRHADAASVAFMAFRDASHDPQMHRAFASILVRGRVEFPPPGAVGPNTFVRLKSDDGRTAIHTIYEDEPIDPIRDEMSMAEAEAAGLVGLMVGDRLPTKGAGWEVGWTIAEILPAIVAAFRDVVENFESRFPTAPFFVTGFRMGEEAHVRDFAPFIASLGDRRRHIEAVFDLQRQQVLPLGLVASQIGSSLEDLIDSARADPDGTPPVIAEWSDTSGQAESFRTAVASTGLIIARSAMKTLLDLDLEHRLQGYELIAPASLVEQVKRELRVAEELVSTGRKTLFPGSAGIAIEDLPPASGVLVARAEHLRRELAFLEGMARLQVRPLAFVAPPGSPEDSLRDAIGHDSYDSIALGYDLGVPLVADDLGLRRLVFANRDRVVSTSSIALIQALVARDEISSVDGGNALLELVLRRYEFVPPSIELLDRALQRMPEIGDVGLARAFALLGSPLLELAGAASMAAAVLKGNITRPVRTASTRRITEISLSAMSTRWPGHVVAGQLMRATAHELYLLPEEGEEVKQAILRFRR